MKKKFLICTLLVSAMLCVSACDNKPETTETDTVTDKMTETEVQKTEATVEKVSLKITNEKTPLYQVVYSTDIGTDRKAAVKQFVIIFGGIYYGTKQIK